MRRIFYSALILFAVLALIWTVCVSWVAYGPNRSHRMDVYSSPFTSNAPVILMLHGGSWTTGSRRWPDAWLFKVLHLVPKGYVFVSATTRLLPEADQLEQVHDFALALKYVQDNAHRWGGDGKRVVLIGHSSGAHVASLVATRQDILADVGASAPLGAIMLDTSAIDVGKRMRNSPRGFLSRFIGSDRAFWDEISPAEHVDPEDPPLLFACATNRAWPCAIAKELASRASQVAVLPVDESHRGVNATLGRRGDYTKSVDLWLKGLGLP